MSKFLCNQTLISIITLGLCSLYLGYSLHQLMINNLLRLAEANNSAMTREIKNNIGEKYDSKLKQLQTLSNAELRQNDTVLELGQHIRRIAKQLKLLKLNILAINGHIIFSTEQKQLGVSRLLSPAFISAGKGTPNSHLEHRQIVNTPDDMLLDRDIVVSYLPVKNSDTNVVDAIYEVISDVTDLTQVNDKNNFVIDVGIALIYMVVVGLILAGVRGKNRLIMRQASIIEKQNAKLEHKSYHDPLTGLPNRVLFSEQLQRDMQRTENNDSLLAVMVISLSRLQRINDTLGYQFGDGLLLETAVRLKQCIRRNDTVGRLSGDKFVAVLQGITVVDQVEEIAEHILEAIAEPYYVDHNELFIFPCIGISMFPFVADDSSDSLIRQANAAMYKADAAGRNTYRFYTPIITKQATSRFTIENALRRALECNEFELYYQPIILLNTNEIYGLEALLRWRSPEFGMVSPLEFIPLLEDTGMIKEVGLWVLEEACQQGVNWHQQGYHNLKMHVNVSAIQFLQKEIVRQVDNAIDSSGIKPHLLDLEITESLLIDGVSQTIETLETLNAMGVSLSIDDFGTGYSSLAYLKRLPIDTLKIDRSFVRDVAHNFDDAAIVDAICALSRSLRFKVIVEGIETKEQLNYMTSHGVSAAQGYYFSRPMPIHEVSEFLSRMQNFTLVTSLNI